MLAVYMEYLKEIGTGANFPWAYWLEVVIEVTWASGKA